MIDLAGIGDKTSYTYNSSTGVLTVDGSSGDATLNVGLYSGLSTDTPFEFTADGSGGSALRPGVKDGSGWVRR